VIFLMFIFFNNREYTIGYLQDSSMTDPVPTWIWPYG
jgi:hypothetical protein